MEKYNIMEIIEDKNAPVQNMYLTTVLTAFKEFLQEEAAGNIFSEVRLIKKIESARMLFMADRDILDNIIKTDDRLSNSFYICKKKGQHKNV